MSHSAHSMSLSMNASSSMSSSTGEKQSKAEIIMTALSEASVLRGQYAVSQIGTFGYPTDELQAVVWLLQIASQRCTQRHLVEGSLPAASPFTFNDALQSVAEFSLAQLKGATPWDKRQTLLRTLMSPERTELTLALLRNDTDTLRAAGFEPMTDDPLGQTYLNEGDGIMLHMWRSPTHARRWTTKCQRCAQAMFECRLQPLCAPVSVLTASRATSFTFSCVVPIRTVAPLQGDPTADALASALGSVLGFVSREGADEEIGLDNLDAPLKATPAKSVTAVEASIVAGLDGRYYCVNPDVFGLDLIATAQGSRAIDHADDALQHVVPDAMHLCFPKGMTADGANNIKAVAHTVSTTGVHNAVAAIASRADAIAKANGGSKIQDFIAADVLTSCMKLCGVNKCYLYAVWNALKSHASPHAGALCEIAEAEIIFRTLKCIFRAEVLTSADKSDHGILRVFNRTFSAMNSGDAQVWAVLNTIIRRKFKAPQTFTLVQSSKLSKLALWHMAPRLGVTFDQAAAKFNKLSFVSPYAGTLSLPDLCKLQQKQPDVYKQYHSAPTAIWSRMPESNEKAMRMMRQAFLGFLTKGLSPTEALDALAPIIAASAKSQPVSVPASLICWHLAQMNDFATHAAVRTAFTVVEMTGPTAPDATNTESAIASRWRADSQHSAAGINVFMVSSSSRPSALASTSISAAPDTVAVAVESLLQAGGEVGLQFSTMCAIVLTRAAMGVEHLSSAHAWLLRRARKICSEALLADDQSLFNASTAWICAAAGITSQPRPSLLRILTEYAFKPALSEALERRRPPSQDEDDVETIVALVRYLVAVCTLNKARQSAVMALVEYGSFINDSVQLSSHAVTPKSTIRSWAQAWQQKDIDDLRETTASKTFASCLGALCLDALRPEWALIALTVKVVELSPVSIPNGMSNPKMAEAASRLAQAHAAAVKIASLMRRVVQRPGCQLASDLVAKWSQAEVKPEGLAPWTTKSLTSAATIYAIGIDDMQQTRFVRLATEAVREGERLHRQVVTTEESAAWALIMDAAASGASEYAMAALLVSEATARTELMLGECVAASTYLHDHAIAVVDIEAASFYLVVNAAAAFDNLLAHEATARLAIETEWIDLSATLAFDLEWSAWLTPLHREHASLTTGAAFAELFSAEQHGRASVELAALLDFVPSTSSALEDSDEFTLDDAAPEVNIDDAWFHSGLSRIATSTLAQLAMTAFNSAAFYTFFIEELTERQEVEESYWLATAETSTHLESVQRAALFEAAAVAQIDLCVEAWSQEHELVGQDLVRQLQRVQAEANSAALEAAIDQAVRDEEDGRAAVMHQEARLAPLLVDGMETTFRRGIQMLSDAEFDHIEAAEAISRLVAVPESVAREKRYRSAALVFPKFVQELALLQASDLWQQQCEQAVIAAQSDEAGQRAAISAECDRVTCQTYVDGFDNWVFASHEVDMWECRLLTAEEMYAERKTIAFAECVAEQAQCYAIFADEACVIYRNEYEAELDRFRVEQFNDQLRCAMTEISTVLEPDHRRAVVQEEIASRSLCLLSAREAFAKVLLTDYCATVLAPMLAALEKDLRRSLQWQAQHTFWLTFVQDVEQSERAAFASMISKQRSVLKKQRTLLADEMTQRLAMEAQVEKMYENSAKVMYLLVRAMTAGPRATLMPPSERQLMHRREEQRMAHETSMTPSPQKSIHRTSQRDLPLGAVVLQDVTLLQQAGLLESMLAMRFDQELQAAAVEAEELHRRWQLGPLTDHVVLPDDDSPRHAPRMTPEAFASAVTSIFAKEMWRRQQIVQVHFDFMSSCRVEFKELDTLLRGEKRIFPRSTLILDLPCVSPLYFTCFVELAQRMTKPKEKDVSKTVQRRMAQRRMLPEHTSGLRSRSMSVASSAATTHLTFSGFGYGFDESVKCISKMKKIFVACDRGISAMYEEENKQWVRLLALEKHGRIVMEEATSLATSARKRHTESTALSYDPTAVRALELPQGPLSGRVSYFATGAAVALTEAEHRLKVAMAEAEHRFELLRRLNSEKPAASNQKSIFSPNAPIPFYLDERHLVKVARARGRPVPLEMSPPRNLSGSPLAGAGGYSFYTAAVNSHSPERPRPRPLAPLSPIRTRTDPSMSTPRPDSSPSQHFLSPQAAGRSRIRSLPALSTTPQSSAKATSNLSSGR